MAGGRAPGASDVQILLDKVERDATLPARIRRFATTARPHAATHPAHVREQIEALWRDVARSWTYEAPSCDLFRCVPAVRVQKYMAADPWPHADMRAFLLAARSGPDPAAWVRSLIPSRTIVFPAMRSWLVASDDVPVLTSRDLVARLELGPESRPPFVVFRLTPELMRREGVTIRRPNALDAAAGGHTQWSPAGLSLGPEYVDRDVPIEAVAEILWRP